MSRDGAGDQAGSVEGWVPRSLRSPAGRAKDQVRAATTLGSVLTGGSEPGVQPLLCSSRQRVSQDLCPTQRGKGLGPEQRAANQGITPLFLPVRLPQPSLGTLPAGARDWSWNLIERPSPPRSQSCHSGELGGRSWGRARLHLQVSGAYPGWERSWSWGRAWGSGGGGWRKGREHKARAGAETWGGGLPTLGARS